MSLQQVSESEEEEYHSLPGQAEETGEDDDDAESTIEPPVHPVPSMQGAFEESILESTDGDNTSKAPVSQDAEARRHKLLEAKQYDDSWTTRWKQKSGAQHHPLLKLMAQIVFGMHLLQQQQAKSNEEVVKILQTHVNEVDTFLEQTAEDFDLAIADIEERIRHLKLPMTHLDVFNSMLDDKSFRTQLLDGNDNIEKIIDRTAKAMNAALMDIQRGLHATQELGKYLDQVKDDWPREKQDIAEVFNAMRGNEQGWLKYLKDLQAKGNKLGNDLIQLGTVIGEMSKLAAAASRRNRPQSRPISPARSAPVSPDLRSKYSRIPAPPVPTTLNSFLNKPLPKEPDAISGAAQVAIPKLHPVPFAQRYESPRPSPRSPAASARNVSVVDHSSPSPQRPKTAGAARDPRYSKPTTTELAEFLRNSGPLRSNPPDQRSLKAEKSEKKLTRSQSQGANELLSGTAAVNGDVAVTRAKSHGAAVILTQPQSKAAKSRPSSRGADQALSVKSAPASRKDSVASTGFARRLSQRKKHLPPDEKGSDEEAIALMPPPYSPDAKGQPPTKKLIDRTQDEKAARPPSRLGLFPRSSEPLTPSAASLRGNGDDPQPTNGQSPSSSAATSPASTRRSKGRSLSIRNLFHRKHRSQDVAV